MNQQLFHKVRQAVSELETEIKSKNIDIDGVMGSGILDYVAASIVLFNACYYFNKLAGHEIKVPFQMKLEFKEVEQLSITSLQRFLHLEKDRFEKNIKKELQSQPMFRRLKKKAEANVEYLKKAIKDIESKV